MSKELIRYNQLSKGFGIFPYVIVRIFSTIYMQIPIHLFGEIGQQSYEEYPGIQIYNLPEDVISEPHRQKMKSCHEKLILLTQEIQDTIKHHRNQIFRVCLVLHKDWCYFFEEKEIKESDSIPEGGILLNEGFEIIAMHKQHFNESQDYSA